MSRETWTPEAGPHDPEVSFTLDTSGGGCWAVADVLVPATIQTVWESVSTGHGYARWFVPATVEQRAGGRLVTDHGSFGTSEGTITAWDPPHRIAYREEDWMGNGTAVPPWHTTVTLVTGPARPVATSLPTPAGAGCVHVRLASGVAEEGERWREDIAGTRDGWIGALRMLAQYHVHFPGQSVAQLLVQREVPHGFSLLEAAGVDVSGAAIGDDLDSGQTVPGLRSCPAR